MTSAGDRWDVIARVCEAALLRGGADRATFLAETCGSDTALRQEVESLLAQESAAVGFMSRPAAAVLPAQLDDPPLMVGRTLGSYTIQARVGAGGMGEVFRARDERLARDVAVKVLPGAFVSDPDRLGRFEREARILATLAHPNIAGIHAVEEFDGTPALVLEFVEGLTLADRLAKGPVAEADAIAIVGQLLDALEAAHERGIVHRDLKPSNIKITPAGRVKVLDFGLAKGLSEERRPDGAVPQTGAPGRVQSSVGAVLGTFAYMSPEQARGELVDSRSDLFSLGVVCYEMLTGRPAFGDGDPGAVIGAILHHEPPPPRSLNPLISRDIEAIVFKLIAKPRDDRYASASQVRADLRALEQRYEDNRAAPVARSPRYLRLAAIGALPLAVLGLLALRHRPMPLPVAAGAYTQVTHFADSATSPSLAHDGKRLTFIRGDNTFVGPGQVYVKSLPDGESIPLTDDRFDKGSPAFSPDDSHVAYTTQNGRFVLDTWLVPTAGGTPVRWLSNASGLSWTQPRQVAFARITGGLHMDLVASGEDRAAVRTIYRPPGEMGMAHHAAVSPDGARLLVVEMDAPVWKRCRLVPADGPGPGAQVGPAGQCTSAAWSPDGRWMYFSSNASGTFHLWRQRFPDGAPEQLTSGPTEEEGVAVTPDGRALFTAIGNRQSSMWVHDQAGDHEISTEGFAFVPRLPIGMSQPFSSDGRSVFYLSRQRTVRFTGPEERVGDLWRTDVESRRSAQLFPGFDIVGWDVSRDGRQVAFAAIDSAGASNIWLARLGDGRASPRRLSSLEADSPRFGPDGEVYCRGHQSGYIYRLPSDGGPPVSVVATPVIYLMSVSPDGAWLMARIAGQAGTAQSNVAFPIDGTAPTPFCDSCAVDWTPDGRSLVVRVGSPDPRTQARTYVIQLDEHQMLPRLPAGGIHTEADLSTLPIGWSAAGYLYPANQPGLYAFSRSSIQRNIYRIELP
jgi:Tol biopolymer transport system component